MLSSVGDLSCSLDFGTDYGTNRSYRRCSPADYYPGTRRPAIMDTISNVRLTAGVLGERRRAKSRGRSTNLINFLYKSSDKDFHSAPMTYFDDDTDSADEVVQHGTGARPSPLRQFGTMVGCFLGVQHKNGEKKPAAGGNRTQPLDLLDLGQKQQDPLAVKQDTIELLESKVEQLQSVLSSPRSVHQSPLSAHPSPATTHPSPRFSPSPLQSHKGHARITDFSAERPEGCSTCHTDDEFCYSPVHDPYLEAKMVEKAVFESAILHLFGMTAVKTRVAVRYFCKFFMKQMELSGYSVLRTLAEVDRSTKFWKKEHAAFCLESRVNKTLYRSFENDSFDEVGITRIINPEKRCVIRLRDYQRLKPVEAADAVNPEHDDFDHDFWTFTQNKLREIWFLFPWNLVFKDSQEKSTFNAAFLEAAKCVWQLHRLAFSVHPSVTILRVEKGMHANSKYVEQVTPIDEQCRRCEGPKIEFMTMPGFQTQKRIIKCQVYRHVECV